MTDHQIRQIMKAMEAQNEVLETIQANQEAMEKKLEPIHELFESVTGFNQISVWILKGLVLLGAGVGVIYGLIIYLKK